MKTTVETSDTERRTRTPSIAERLVVHALRDMRAGSMTLKLPDGRTHSFGESPENTSGPHAVVRVLRPGFFRRCLFYGDIGFAESYLEGEWETEDITQVIRFFLANVEQAPTVSGSRKQAYALNVLRLANRLTHLLRPNSLGVSRRNIRAHYDLSNEFFSTFLDRRMTYSSGLWRHREMTLDEAQEAKYERLCQKLRLTRDDHVLEIGCGWGGFALYASRNYGCRVTGLTISREQQQYARQAAATSKLDSRVEIRLEDYRKHAGTYTRIVSIEMLEAVGHRYLPEFSRACQRLLHPEGLMALQFITCPDSRYKELRRGVDFIQKHIFPGSLLLSQNRLNQLLTRDGEFWLHDLRDLGLDYSRTLREWRSRFDQALPVVKSLGFDEAFIRKWRYYLSYCEAAFAARNISVVQAVYTRPNNPILQEPAAPLPAAQISQTPEEVFR